MNKQSLYLWGTYFLVASAVSMLACADDGAEAGVTAAECVNNDLIAQCPPNTTARLDADSSAECSNSAGASGDAVSLSISGESVCVGTGNCVVVCDLIAPCSCGVDSINTETGVTCSECAVCGDGNCQMQQGENATDCPVDCATECTPNTARCTTGQLERCNGVGSWEDPVDCVEGERCVDDNDGTASCVADDE